ncbi:MAG TPA: DUF2341 domain-containing protein [Chitinispirillaceae bacterium]|nr:DUF2341 domain-containing protein [Chitinispirillaceae bacterium]
MKNRVCLLASLMGSLLLTFMFCMAPVQLTEGNSSETVIGRVVNSDGSPACSAIVALYPADYDPIAVSSLLRIPADTTDSSGYYRIAAPDSTKELSIVATSQQSGDLAMLSSIVVSGDTTSVPDAVLSVPGAIMVEVPESVAGGYVYIPGTGIAAEVNSSGMILLNNVPAGVVPSVNYNTGTASGVLISDVEVTSADTTIIPYPQLRYSKKIYLNTTASGAGVTEDVKDFPVLVRLSGSTFDFAQARADGKDLGFSVKDGTRIAHEIEQWDAVKKRAAVWVRVPVVLGDNDSQYIVMHWGASVPDVSVTDGSPVFDTLSGFQSVWHLSGTDTAFDATENHYHGIPFNMNPDTEIEGVIGSARHFDGNSSYITVPNSASGKLDMPQNSDYSISLWAYADTIDTLWHAIAGKGHEQYYLKMKCFANGKGTWEFVEFQDQLGWEYSEDSIPPLPGVKEWVYLTGVRSGTRQYLYINGELVNDTMSLMAGSYPRVSSDDFTIGKHAREVTIPGNEGWCHFRGKIDEVRVMSTALSPDWIRLCYMNQKEEDMLVEFR